MRIVALLQTFNERRFIAGCIEHLAAEGVQVYLIDNESTDGTPEIAEAYLGRGLIGIERLPRDGHWDLHRQLRRKQELAASLDADWFMHIDADERHVAPDSQSTLADALREADQAGFNAVNFLEFAFVPTIESPDHDHPDFARTMRWYYAVLPSYPHRLNAWKRRKDSVDLVSSDGHQVAFPELRMAPRNLYMRHYLFLSVEHALEKYERKFEPVRATTARLKGNWRLEFTAERITLPSQKELRRYVADDALDRTEPYRSQLPVRRR